VPAGGGEHDWDALSQELPDHVLEAARNGNHAAFAALVQEYEPKLRAVVFYIVQDDELGRDALQETFLRAYRGLPRFREQAALGTWLHRIAYTAALEQLRTRRRHPEEPLPDDVDRRLGRGGDPGDEIGERDLVSSVLAALPPEQRLVLLLIDRDGYDYRSVAEITGTSPGTVCSRLQRARGKVRAALTRAPSVRSASLRTEES